MEILTTNNDVMGPLRTGKVTVILVAYYADKWLPGCIDTLVDAKLRSGSCGTG